MKLPSALVLYSIDKAHAGFMLMAQAADNNMHSCVFMLSPVSAEGINSKMGIVVSELKMLGEQTFTIIENDSGYTILLEPDGLPKVKIEVDAQFSGQAFTTFDNQEQVIGTVQAVASK